MLIGERAEQQRAFAQPHQHRPLNRADGWKFTGFISPCLSQVAAETDRRPKVKFYLVGWRIETAHRHQATVQKLNGGIVNPRKSRAFAAGTEIGFAARRAAFPGLPFIATPNEACRGLVAIERQKENALAGADWHVTDLSLRLQDLRLRPGGAAVVGSPHDVPRQTLGEKEQGVFAIEPEFWRGSRRE